MKASDLFVKALENEGVEYIFGIPGEENLDILESLRKSKQIKLILTRHEQGAAFMAATYGPAAFAIAQAALGSWFGQLVLWGMTFSLFYHLGNGIRHLAWDAGWGYELDRMRISGWLTVIFAAAMTVLTLVVAYSAAGGA